MPIFEFQCNSCEQEFEQLVFAGDSPDITCPECSSRDVTKKMSAASFMGKSMGTCAADTPKGFS